MLDAVWDSGSCQPYRELQIRSCHSLITAFSNKHTHTRIHQTRLTFHSCRTPLPHCLGVRFWFQAAAQTCPKHISHCPSLHTLFQAVHLFHPLSPLSSFLITIVILSLLFSAPLLLHLVLFCSPSSPPSLFHPNPQPLCQTQDFHLKDIKQMLLGEWCPRLGSRLTSIPSLAVVFTPLFCCPNLFHVHKLLLILYLCVPCRVFVVYLPHSLCFFLSR